MGVKKQIFEKLEEVLETLPWVVNVEWEKIKVIESDIAEHETPLIQIYDTNELHTHQGGLIETTLAITIELVLRKTSMAEVNQGLLFDYVEEIETKMGENISLSGTILGFRQFKYVSGETDLHTTGPFYYGALNFDAIYTKPHTFC